MKKVVAPVVLRLLVQIMYAAAPIVTGSNLKFSSLDGNRFSGSFEGNVLRAFFIVLQTFLVVFLVQSSLLKRSWRFGIGWFMF